MPVTELQEGDVIKLGGKYHLLLKGCFHYDPFSTALTFSLDLNLFQLSERKASMCIEAGYRIFDFETVGPATAVSCR